MDKDTAEMIDRVVGAIFQKEPDDLRRKGQQKAAHVFEQGVSGSPFAWGQHVVMHYDHYREYANKVCDALLQVAQNSDAPVEAGLAAELKALFDRYTDPLIAKTRSKVSEIMQMPIMGNGPSKTTFDEIHKQTRTDHHNEIDLWVRKAIADRKRKVMNVTYNLTGPNARVNVQSTDNSTNYSIDIKDSKLIFKSIREAVIAGVKDEAVKNQLVEKVGEMESAVGDKTKFIQRYLRFVEIAANHMDVIGPWIPALTQLCQ